MTRREAIGRGAAAAAGWIASSGCLHRGRSDARLAVFTAEVTVPLGHGMMGGAWLSRRVMDPLEARGFVLLGEELPVVFVSVDWCEIRNDAYARWQSVLAQAAGTRPDRVMISTIHQHDAPLADLGAERILRAARLEGTVCDPVFHELAVGRVAEALRQSLTRARQVTHYGTGMARVEKVASNRRYTLPEGSVRWDRTSATRNAFAISADVGLIDPWLRQLSFWDGHEPLVAASFYAVHPMSYYGQGDVSADFPGLARRQHEQERGGLPQIYVSGCSGNVTAGKYNDGSPGMRPVLADRIRAAMSEAWGKTVRQAFRGADFRVESLRLEPRQGDGFDVVDLRSKLVPGVKPFTQCLAAMGLSWRERVATGRPIEVPCLDLGGAALLVLPGESYVEYQLAAQRERPADFICVAGYGDGATGYVPTELHWAEHDTNLGDWCWVAPGAEERMRQAISRVLRTSRW